MDALRLYLRRGERELLLFLPGSEPSRSRASAARSRGCSLPPGGDTRGTPRHAYRARSTECRPLGIRLRGSSSRKGFAATAMGIQARDRSATTSRVVDRWILLASALRQRPVEVNAWLSSGAIHPKRRSRIRALARMEDSDIEHDRVRSSNDRISTWNAEGVESTRNRGYDDAARGEDLGDVDDRDLDPDSAASDVDRNDSVDE